MSENVIGSIRVLVIDDQRTMRTIVRDHLARVGIHDVTEAGDGEAALDLLHQLDFTPPDVIICDLHMEKMDGMEFCNALRRLKDSPLSNIPVIILTGETNRLLLEVTQQVGAVAILTKPLAADDLLHEIQAAIGFTGEPSPS